MYLTHLLLLLLLQIVDFTGMRLVVPLLRHSYSWLLRWQWLLPKRLEPWL